MPESDSLRPAPDVAKVAKALMAEHHSHLTLNKIVFLFTSKVPTKGGKIVLARTSLVSELEAAAFGGDDEGLEADFIMVVTGSEWAIASPQKREAIVDHELCHCYYDTGTGKAKLAEHDLDEFNEVIRRHGLWRDDVRKTARALQPHLAGLDLDDTQVTITSAEKTVETTLGAIAAAAEKPKRSHKKKPAAPAEATA